MAGSISSLPWRSTASCPKRDVEATTPAGTASLILASPARRPEAPDFSAKILDSDERFELSAQRGNGVILIFFLHTCPHCHYALAALRDILESLPEDSRPTLVGIEVTGLQITPLGPAQKAIGKDDVVVGGR